MRSSSRARVVLALAFVASAAPSCGFETRDFGGDAVAGDAVPALDAADDPDDGLADDDASELEP